MKRAYYVVLSVIIAMAVTIMALRLVMLLSYTKPIPKCNESWPQSHSDLVIQPCPTPRP